MRYPLVLAYHDVSPALHLSGNWVLPCVFKNHMRFLMEKFSPVSPKNIPYPLPNDKFLVTFDDALEGVYKYAFPIMEDLGTKGLVFVVTDYIGQRNVWDAHFGVTMRHMDRSALIELNRSGWCIGSHTVTHRSLTTLSDKEIIYELEYSKKYLEDLIGEEVYTLSYPFNMYDGRVLKIAKELGYRFGFVGPAIKHDFTQMNIPRIPVTIIDMTLRHKLFKGWAAIDIALTTPSRLTPLFQRLKKVV